MRSDKILTDYCHQRMTEAITALEIYIASHPHNITVEMTHQQLFEWLLGRNDA